MDAVIPPRDPCHLFSFYFGKADNLLLRLLLSAKTSLKLLSFSSAEVVTTADHVGSVCVMGRIERGGEGEHFCCVPAATEDDEKVGWCPAFARRWTAAVDGGEDIDETELPNMVN